MPGGKILPLNWDALTDLLLACLGTPVCQNFLGTLDQNGHGAAVFDTLGPLDPVLIGETLHFAYLLKGWQGFNFTSNPVAAVFEP